MSDEHTYTKETLIRELDELRRRNAELEEKVRSLEDNDLKNEKIKNTLKKACEESEERVEECRDELKQYQAVFNGISAMIKVVDKNYNLLNISSSLMRAYKIPENERLIGLKCYRALKERNTVCPGCTVEQVFKSGKLMTRLSTTEEEERTGKSCKFYSSPLKDKDSGQIIGAVEVVTDVTDLRKMERSLKIAKEEAESANRAKTEFLSNMSHEFRTPLNAILGYTQLFRYDKQLDEKYRNAIQTIHRSGEQLLMMINDILALSKIEAGVMEPELSDFNLPDFLRRIADIARFRSQEQGISFEYRLDPDLPTGVYGDERCLRQILLNLLGNAVKFTRQGKVTFNVRRQQSSNNGSRVKLCFHIEDTGIGIPHEKMTKIFLPFHQIKDWRIQSQGTGLGLTISRKLLHKMNSELFVESVADEGSVFWFELEFSETTSSESIIHEEKHIIGFKGRPRKILIVDDDELNRTVLKDILFPMGFEIMEAVNGHDALNKAAGFCPDLILMDLLMPVMDGFEAAQEIRKIYALKHVTIIAISARVNGETRKICQTLGYNDYITKPIHIADLMEVLKKHLKTEWIYEDEEERKDTSQEKEEAIIPPSKEELDVIFNLAMKGDVFGLQEWAEALKSSDIELVLFSEKISRFAKDFLIEELQEFIGQYR